jgi:hypothetical protein
MRRAVFVFSLVTAAAAVAWGADRTPEWVEERVRQWQPTAAEKRWETIGWAQDIRSAVRLGKEHNRPVFLFTLDGRMGVGRC